MGRGRWHSSVILELERMNIRVEDHFITTIRGDRSRFCIL